MLFRSLVAGMVDALEAVGIPAFGPTAAAAAIEGSKVFSKQLMKQYDIPTAQYEVFDDPDAAIAYIRQQNRYPAVIKADGLALGKGVLLCADEAEAVAAIDDLMRKRVFGDAGTRVVVEEFLTGPEVSVLAFTDGVTVRPMVSAKDHKRALDNDRGLNTGGMGTVSPNPHYTQEQAEWCLENIFQPTVDAMRAEGCPFKGCLFFGLMLTPDGPKVIEYNCRFGDPETQVVLPRLRTDFLDIIDAIRAEQLSKLDIEWSADTCACVVLASGGYPEAYEKGKQIHGLDAVGQSPLADAVYHAGTAMVDDGFVTAGGRVLGITASAPTLSDALSRAYAAAAEVRFDGVHYRRDIGASR